MSSNAQKSGQLTSGDAQNALETDSSQPGQNANQTNNNNFNASQGNQNNAFSHPGARAIFEGAMSGDGPYECRKCHDAGLTVTVTPCPACLDPYPWLPHKRN